MTVDGRTDDAREILVRGLALLERASMPAGVGVPASAGDGSPSRDRLVRIATMIRDAELAMPTPSPRHSKAQEVRLIRLSPRRYRARQLAEAAAVELAS
jgi:hypothetical protein